MFKLCFLSQNVADCFPACESSRAATDEGRSLCRLTKSISELADIITTTINNDLATGFPVLDSISRFAKVIIKNPLAGFANITDIISDVQTLRNMFNTTADQTKLILDAVNNIIDAGIILIREIISPQ
jgi:hypothetical protein